MAMTLTSIRSLVRDISDLDATDLPNSLLDTYVREGFQRIVALERQYPFYEEEYTLTTVANTQTYTISTLGDIREIISITDTSSSGVRLQMIAHDDAEETWLGDANVASRPLFYTIWKKKIYLWPKPAGIYTLTVRAYRNPLYTWLDSILVAVDADEWFHVQLAYFVLARVFQRQEDPQMSAMYMQSFEQGVGISRRDVMATPSARPLILSGGRIAPSFDRWLLSLGQNQW